MRADVARDLGASAKAFEMLVWPAIKDKIGGGELAVVESVTNTEFAQTIDIMAGIDAWQIVDGTGIRGVASRVQPTERNWRTFTIRLKRRSGAETEFAKRKRALLRQSEGWLYPHYTIQAYCTYGDPANGKMLGCGIVRTIDLFEIVDAGLSDAWEYFHARKNGEYITRPPIYIQHNWTDGNLFVVCKWDAIIKAGRELIEV